MEITINLIKHRKHKIGYGALGGTKINPEEGRRYDVYPNNMTAEQCDEEEKRRVKEWADVFTKSTNRLYD